MNRTVLLLLACVAVLFGYSSGPPDGKTGRPGEGTCLDCHSGGSGSADSAFITGFAGATYTPGQTYSLSLHVNYAGQLRWGFELTTAAVSSDDYAGQLIVIDSINTQLSTSGGRDYLKHTAAGTHRGQADSVTWVFQWQAPSGGTGPVMFYWCSNAADNNGSSSGDIIIRDSLYLGEATGVNERRAGTRRYSLRYANPTRERVAVEYEGDPAAPVRIYSPSGRLVRCLTAGESSGRLRVMWDGRDMEGKVMPGATYFVHLGTGMTRVARIELVR